MFIKYAMLTRVASPKTPFNINIFEPTNFEPFIKPLDFKRFSSFQKQKKKAKVFYGSPMISMHFLSSMKLVVTMPQTTSRWLTSSPGPPLLKYLWPRT
jgi:hypothetical protein